ncbi:MAG TPA: 23S rRNA methyltransferase, partial [Gammaproteobacteria bacterium]|nr:23S rRNA methyltransferase [Gammaproteobacteria bacterium]
MAKKTGSSKRWLSRHAKDTYVEAAKNSGFRSRASYKLIQVQEKYGVLGAGQTVVDLGAAPGGFSQVARDLVGEKGSVIALDLLDMEPLSGVHFIKGDFTEESTLKQLLQFLDGQAADLVISDMA